VVALLALYFIRMVSDEIPPITKLMVYVVVADIVCYATDTPVIVGGSQTTTPVISKVSEISTPIHGGN